MIETAQTCCQNTARTQEYTMWACVCPRFTKACGVLGRTSKSGNRFGQRETSGCILRKRKKVSEVDMVLLIAKHEERKEYRESSSNEVWTRKSVKQKGGTRTVVWRGSTGTSTPAICLKSDLLHAPEGKTCRQHFQPETDGSRRGRPIVSGQRFFG